MPMPQQNKNELIIIKDGVYLPAAIKSAVFSILIVFIFMQIIGINWFSGIWDGALIKANRTPVVPVGSVAPEYLTNAMVAGLLMLMYSVIGGVIWGWLYMKQCTKIYCNYATQRKGFIKIIPFTIGQWIIFSAFLCAIQWYMIEYRELTNDNYFGCFLVSAHAVALFICSTGLYQAYNRPTDIHEAV